MVMFKMFGFVECFICFFDSVFDIVICQGCNVDIDSDIGGDVFVKYMWDFKIVYFLLDMFCGSVGLLWFGGGQ